MYFVFEQNCKMYKRYNKIQGTININSSRFQPTDGGIVYSKWRFLSFMQSCYNIIFLS